MTSIKNIPHTIPYTDELIIDGETIIGWDSFRKINEPLPEDKKYKYLLLDDEEMKELGEERKWSEEIYPKAGIKEE